MRFLKLIIFLIIFVSLSACSGAKKARAHRTQRQTPQRVKVVDKEPIKSELPIVTAPKVLSALERMMLYIETYSPLAQEEMTLYGIPASITLAQGILESGSGNGALALKAQNHFGIKCHTTWSGDRVYHDDDEKGECFRKYTDPKYSYRDHSLFLTQRSRYQDLFDLDKDDYKGWAKGLKKAGYATDPKYPDKLISLIERFELWRYDDELLHQGSKASSIKLEEVIYVVQAGDTLYSIAQQFGLTVAQLSQVNGLTGSLIAIGQELRISSGTQ
jgi:flagellum-specific peptidoglycan hydrolase FlgJ